MKLGRSGRNEKEAKSQGLKLLLVLGSRRARIQDTCIDTRPHVVQGVEGTLLNPNSRIGCSRFGPAEGSLVATRTRRSRDAQSW